MTTTMTPITPTRVINFANILPLFTPATVSLTPLRRRDSLPPAAFPALVRGRSSRPARVRKMESTTLKVPRVAGSVSPIARRSHLEIVGVADLMLPLGISRFTNVATLKRMMKARRSDVFLRKAGDTWEICPDSMSVDLADDAVEFRLGPVQIYS